MAREFGSQLGACGWPPRWSSDRRIIEGRDYRNPSGLFAQEWLPIQRENDGHRVLRSDERIQWRLLAYRDDDRERSGLPGARIRYEHSFQKTGRCYGLESTALHREVKLMAMINLKVNGRSVALDVDPATPLLYVLSD